MSYSVSGRRDYAGYIGECMERAGVVPYCGNLDIGKVTPAGNLYFGYGPLRCYVELRTGTLHAYDIVRKRPRYHGVTGAGGFAEYRGKVLPPVRPGLLRLPEGMPI